MMVELGCGEDLCIVKSVICFYPCPLLFAFAAVKIGLRRLSGICFHFPAGAWKNALKMFWFIIYALIIGHFVVFLIVSTVVLCLFSFWRRIFKLWFFELKLFTFVC
jgi:hypothetical protein